MTDKKIGKAKDVMKRTSTGRSLLMFAEKEGIEIKSGEEKTNYDVDKKLLTINSDLAQNDVILQMSNMLRHECNHQQEGNKVDLPRNIEPIENDAIISRIERDSASSKTSQQKAFESWVEDSKTKQSVSDKYMECIEASEKKPEKKLDAKLFKKFMDGKQK